MRRYLWKHVLCSKWSSDIKFFLPSFFFWQSPVQSSHQPVSHMQEHPAQWANLGTGPGVLHENKSKEHVIVDGGKNWGYWRRTRQGERVNHGGTRKSSLRSWWSFSPSTSWHHWSLNLRMASLGRFLLLYWTSVGHSCKPETHLPSYLNPLSSGLSIKPHKVTVWTFYKWLQLINNKRLLWQVTKCSLPRLKKDAI